jgi:hypothetical protein
MRESVLIVRLKAVESEDRKREGVNACDSLYIVLP